MIWENLSLCLREIALQWYIAKLSIDQKIFVKYGTKIEKWEKQLLKQFKLAPNIVMAVLNNKKYTINDAKKQKEPKDYISKIIKVARDVELSTSLNILSIVYNDFDAKFQQDLAVPLSTISINIYL